MTDASPHETDEAERALPVRTPWSPRFAPVAIHTSVQTRDRHAAYIAAKSGNAEAAWSLALDLLSGRSMDELRDLAEGMDPHPILLPVTALETTGFNAIPDAMAGILSHHLGWRVSAGDIVQSNTVGHTRAKSFNRFVTPASFEGPVEPGGSYVLVDDHVGLGGTLANLKGHVETSGGVVVAMTTLTESRDGRHIALRRSTLDMLWERHGEDLEHLWRERLGHGLDCLTNLEAEILYRELSVDAIADRLAEAAVEARRRGLEPAIRVAGDEADPLDDPRRR